MRISTHVNVYFAIAGTARQRHKPTWNERAILYNIIQYYTSGRATYGHMNVMIRRSTAHHLSAHYMQQ